jgi:hypothetical protein
MVHGYVHGCTWLMVDVHERQEQCYMNVEIMICEIAIQSHPLNQDHIWTVDPSHVSKPRQLGTRGTTR